MNDYWNPLPKFFHSFSNPSKTHLFSDGGIRASAPTQYNAGVNQDNPPEAIHDGKANVAFLDGHVEQIKKENIPTGSVPFQGGTPASLFWLGR